MGARLAGLALAAALAPSAACLRSTEFQCAADLDCSAGTCEPNGYCSFADTTCASGRRYGDLSGPVANQCVGDEPGVDAPPGTPDAPPGTADAASLCPADYQVVPNAPNVYRLIAGTAPWTDQQVDCTNDGGGYLIIPSTQQELDAITGFAGGAIWVGVSDRMTEDVWLDVRGGPQTLLPWSGGQPDDAGPGEDCVLATGSTFSDERCGGDHPAVCECEP